MGKVSSHSSHTVTIGVRGFVLLLQRLIVTKELCDRNCIFAVLASCGVNAVVDSICESDDCIFVCLLGKGVFCFVFLNIFCSACK